MKNWTKISLAGFSLASAGVGFALWSGAANWNAETARMIEKLKHTAANNKTKTVSFEDFDNLPAPVTRYFRFALKDGQPIIKTTKIRHTGEFYLNDKWIPFDSEQYFSANPPAFIWDAEMRMNSLMNVRVRDSYLEAKGAMLAKIFSLFTVMNAKSNEKLTSGALQRYLVESAWQPTALLPSEHLKWSEIDENRALATLNDGATTVSLEFRFNEQGAITEVFTPSRFKEVKGEYKPFPWAGRFWNYEERSGMMIPLRGEVEWQMPNGNVPYWKGRIAAVEYEFAR